MASPFETALALQDLEAIRRCPKADLHTHGWANSDGCFSSEMAISQA